MGLDRTTIVVALACASCGGRTAPDLLIGAAQDAAGAGVGSDASGPDVGVDASGPDVGIDASGPPVGIDATDSHCSPTVAHISGSAACRFRLQWTCGDQNFTVDGYCGPSENLLRGLSVCDVNGQQRATFAWTAMPCRCDEPNALRALAEPYCASAGNL